MIITPPELTVYEAPEPESCLTTEEPIADPYYSDIDEPDEPEIIEGLIREAQLASLGGAFGVGKTPLLIDLTVCVPHGLPFCGRATAPRPVVYFDLEGKGKVFRRNVVRSARRRGVRPPTQPQQLETYIEGDKDHKPGTKELRVLLPRSMPEKLDFLRSILSRKPNALIIIDPLERLLRIDTNKKPQVMALYGALRSLLAEFPHSDILMTFNLRKADRRSPPPPLIEHPHGWLQEVCGTLDIHNRSDVRLGMDFYDEDVRVINGVRRGEEMHPLLIRPVGDPAEGLAGFELCPAGDLDLARALTARQQEHWQMLPNQFRFEEVAERLVPRSSLSRLLARVKSLGIVTEDAGVYRKTSGGAERLNFSR